ncbi:unnamed protein product [Rotaria sp. Silwood1]|nr:unnamed protein product [Rotaria sp. Silwood1]
MDRLLTTINTTITVTPGFDTPPIWTGYISVLVAVLFFGSNLVPAAKYSIRDGFSFQFFLCVGIWITGAVINLIVKSPPFFPLVMIGGVLWTTGNIISVYVISINGLGWASGHFGWFGLKPENVDIPAFNYVGVAIACLSGIVFLAIRTRKSKEQLVDSRPIRHFTNSSIINRSFEIAPEGDNEMSSTVNIKMRIIGCSLAILAGILFGLVFTPSTYIQDHQENYPGAVKNGLHYVFAMYTGILLTSSVYYGVYIIFKRNRPYVCVESILPAFISGVMWGIAQAGFIFANTVLSQAISFPLVTTVPATIAALWSIFYFKDIRGLRNYLIFAGGTLLRIIAAVFIIFSKSISN